MLVNLKTLLDDARTNHYAVAGFTTPTIDTCEAVLQAAEDMNAPVIIGQAQLYDEYGPVEKFGRIWRSRPKFLYACILTMERVLIIS